LLYKTLNKYIIVLKLILKKKTIRIIIINFYLIKKS